MNGKILYKLRIIIASLILILAIVGILGIFYPVKIFDLQIVALMQRVITNFSIAAIIILAVLILATLIFGRIYCSLICPLGITQELVGFLKSKSSKKSCTKQANFPLKYFVAAIVWGCLIGGSAIFIRYTDPYSIFVSAITGTVFGGIFLLIVAIAVIIKDRIFCTNFCPVGTLLGIISKISLFKLYINEHCVFCGTCAKTCPSGCINSKDKTIDNETCIKCLKCLEACPTKAIRYGIPEKKTEFSLKRRQLIIAGAALAVFGGMIKAGIELKDKITEKIKDILLPPGAGSKEEFINKCLNCNLCVENCPNKIIKKADENFGAVHLDYTNSYCKFDCAKCGEVCPSGAIKRLSLDDKQHTRIGMAMIDEDKCRKCRACSRACPVHAIIKEPGKPPILNAVKCIGCGACKKACPVGAIEIFPTKEQKLL